MFIFLVPFYLSVYSINLQICAQFHFSYQKHVFRWGERGTTKRKLTVGNRVFFSFIGSKIYRHFFDYHFVAISFNLTSYCFEIL